MTFLKKLFGTSETIHTHADFWNWFVKHESRFYTVIKNNDRIEENFLNKIIPKLHELNPKFFSLVGMLPGNIADFVITADGDIKTFVFVDDLVAAAPALANWKFTALKPAFGTADFSVNMNGYEFNDQHIQFTPIEHPAYPDEIEITLTHDQYTAENKNEISNGCLIYLDNALGELNTAILIDNVRIGVPGETAGEPVPISKLNDFLTWREKEFVEKYKGTRRNTANDSYSTLEAADADGRPIIAVVNSDLLDWDAKPSHPWMMPIEISYHSENRGMPDDKTLELMNEFQETLEKKLRDDAGYLSLGRQTYNGMRTIYFACREFREVSRIVAEQITSFHNRLDISYTIYRDKYWMTMNRFINGHTH